MEASLYEKYVTLNVAFHYLIWCIINLCITKMPNTLQNTIKAADCDQAFLSSHWSKADFLQAHVTKMM